VQEKIKCILKYVFESWEFFQCDNCGKKLLSTTVRARISWNLESAQKLSTNFTCNLPGGSRADKRPARLRQQPACARAAAHCCPPRNEGWQVFSHVVFLVAHLYKQWAWSFVRAGAGILCGDRAVGAVDTIGRSPEGQGVITTSDCNNSCRCSCRIQLYVQDWIKEGYDIRRDFQKCTRIWVWEVTKEDEALWLLGCRRLLWVSRPGRPAALVQMCKRQRMTGLLAGRPVPEIKWHWNASAGMSDSANFYILFAFRGITLRSKITQLLKDWHGDSLKQPWNTLNIICQPPNPKF